MITFRAASGVGRGQRLREPQRDGERDETLLGAVVEVALELSARLACRFDDAGAGGTDLRLLPLALGDVDPGEENE